MSARVRWGSVALFYVIACAISWPFFWWRDAYAESWAAFTMLGYAKGLLPALGPAIGGIIAMAVFRKTHPRTITVFGTPIDITLSELAVETFFPADAATAQALRHMSDGQASSHQT